MFQIIVNILQSFVKGGVQSFMVQAGLTAVSVGSISFIADNALSQVVSSFGALPEAVYQFALLTGFGSFLNIVGSALLTKIALNAASESLGLKLNKKGVPTP